MRLHLGFISNSSSTSFIIVNKTDKPQSIYDFLNDVIHLIDRYNENTAFSFKLSKTAYLNIGNNYKSYFWKAHEAMAAEFGDHDGTVAGEVLASELSQGKNYSDKFYWKRLES